MIQYIQYFFNPAHLFSVRPPVMSDRAIIILAVIFGILIALAVFARLKQAKTKSGLDAKLWEKTFNLSLTTGILGFVYIFFAAQGVVLLAGRFWLLLLGLIAVVWAGFIVRYAKVEIPKKKDKIKQQKEFKKYIP